MQFSAKQQNDNGLTMDSFIRSKPTILFTFFNGNEVFARVGLGDRISRPSAIQRLAVVSEIVDSSRIGR